MQTRSLICLSKMSSGRARRGGGGGGGGPRGKQGGGGQGGGGGGPPAQGQPVQMASHAPQVGGAIYL
jgi:hypothetical protein